MAEDIKPVTILIVEDDPGHARLIEKNLRRGGVNNPFVKLGDGQQALDYLFSEGDYEGHPRPTPLLMLLDLNMPEINGYEVLKRMRANPDTLRIPVVILTTTDDDREIRHCYELGCSVYITKPVDYDDFSEAMKKLGLFLSILAVPNGL